MCYNGFLNFAPQTRAAVPLPPGSRLPPHPSRVAVHRPAPTSSGSRSPLGSALPSCLLSNEQKAPGTPLDLCAFARCLREESALTSHFQPTERSATLSHAESALTDMSPATALESALTKNWGVGVASRSCCPMPTRQHLFPVFATHPKTAPISLFLATLPNSLDLKSFACHTSGKRWGWGRKLLTRNLGNDLLPERPSPSEEFSPAAKYSEWETLSNNRKPGTDN
jgi:hypothetical protein